MRGRAGPRRTGTAAVHHPELGRQRRHHLHPGRPARRCGDQRRRDSAAGAVAPRCAAAAAIRVGLGHAGIGSCATLPAARRRADRPVRPASFDHQRGAATSAVVRTPGLCQGRPRDRRAGPASVVPARLRRQSQVDPGPSLSMPTGPRHRRGRATHWPTGEWSRTRSPTCTNGSARGPPRRGRRRCDWRSSTQPPSRPRSRWSWCSAQAFTPRPRSTRPIWPACSASHWWRAPTWWCATASCGCGRWARSSVSTWCYAASTPSTPIRSTCAQIRGWVWWAWWRCCAAAR